jgi:hypothetical protein
MPMLPPVYQYETDAIASWLYGRVRMQRRPEATAKLLVLAVKLDRDKMPWPTRKAIAEHIGISMAMVDATLQQYRADNLLVTEYVSVPGRNKQRKTMITRKYVRPAQELIDLVRKAQAREKRRRLKEAA